MVFRNFGISRPEIGNSTLSVTSYNHPAIFMMPPWEEIYTQDDERKHSFEDGVKEYDQLLNFYPKHRYSIIEIPKVDVKERVEFILSNINA